MLTKNDNDNVKSKNAQENETLLLKPRRSTRVANKTVSPEGNHKNLHPHNERTWPILNDSRPLRSPIPTAAISNAAAYDTWNASKSGGSLTPVPGCSSYTTTRSTPVKIAATRKQPPSSINLAHQTPTLSSNTGRLALQWNVNGFLNNIHDIEMQTTNQPPAFLALQEIHRVTIGQLNRSLGGKYSWSIKHGNNKYQTSAIGVLRPISWTRIALSTRLPVVAIRSEHPFPLSVVNIYLPQGIENLFSELRKILFAVPKPYLIMGDFNAHHPRWGSPKANTRGSIIVNIAEELDLVCLNDGSQTFHSGRRESAIDITFASAEIAQYLGWSIDDDPAGSDHSPITITAPGTAPQVSRRPRWKYKEANWENFRTLLEDNIYTSTPTNIDSFIEATRQAALASIPRTKSTPGPRETAWWTEATKVAVAQRRKKLRAFQRAKRLAAGDTDTTVVNNLDEVKDEYKISRNNCRQVIRNAKHESWSQYLDGINADQSATELWRRVNCLSGKRKHQEMAIKHNGCITRDPSVVSEVLGDYFQSISAHEKYPSKFRTLHDNATNELNQIHIPDDQNKLPINKSFGMRELTLALERSKGKSEGIDEVGYPLLSHLPFIGRKKFLELLNQEWENRSIPESWRHSLVIPIPKKETADGTPSSYRPISLTCCASKLLERMVNRRLMQWMNERDLLDHRQHAFRPGRGVGTYFTDLGEILSEGLAQGHVEIAALDLAKAYNRAWTPGVLEQLIRLGLAGNIVHYLRNFLRDRTFQVCVGNYRSRHRQEETGVPQGSVIAVTIFLVAMNGVFARLPKDMFALTYADDVVLIASGRTEKRIRRKIQAAVTSIVHWTDQTGFELAAAKCELIHICNSRHKVLGMQVHANNQKIPIKKTIRLLGVQIDRHMTFINHINATKENCKTRLNLLKAIASRHKKCNRRTLLQVANATVNSRLLYGIELLCAESEKIVSNLAPVYNRAVRTVSGLLPCTPPDVACAEAGVLPFRHKFATAVIKRAISHTERTTGSQEKVHLHREADRLLQQHSGQALPPVDEVHWTGTRGWNEVQLQVDTAIKRKFRAGSNTPLLRATINQRLTTKYKFHCIRYSDGSKANGRVGIGVAGDINLSRRLADTCSIFTAEAAAAFYATTEMGPTPRLVITDSASVIAALQSDDNQHPWIQAIQETAGDTVFMWAPGHCGIPGNEKADQLANLGREERISHSRVPGDDARKYTTRLIHNNWASSWASSMTTHLRKIKNTPDRWDDTEHLRDQRVLSRLRTGYTRFSYRMSGDGPFRIQCPTCCVHNSVEHVLLICPEFHQLRQQHRVPHNIREALGDDTSTAAQIISFLKETKLYFET